MSGFIKNLSHVVEPLRQGLRKNSSFEWGNSQRIAFKELKKLLKSDTIMAYWNPNRETRLTVDASPTAQGQFWSSSNKMEHIKC